MTNTIIENAKQLEGKKVLYFEGAGMDFKENNLNQSDVLNHRIRTSFINNNGEQIYLEMGNTYKRDNKGKSTEKMGTWVDFCHKVPTDGEETKYNEIYSRTKEHLELGKMDYTTENITKWINEKLNCSFDTIHVIDRFYGYYVHGENGACNLMENIELNHERAANRSQAYDLAMNYYKDTRKFPCLSVLEMKENGLLIRCHAYKDELKGLEQEKEFSIQ